MIRDYSKTDFTCENCTIETFIEEFYLQYEASECFKDYPKKTSDSEMINSLLKYIGQDTFVAILHGWWDVSVCLNKDKKELRDTKRVLKLALLQLKEHNENDLIIIEGEEEISISKTLETLS